MNAPLGATAKLSTPGGPNGTSEIVAAARSKCARKRRLSTCWLYMAITSASAAAATRVSWATACAANTSRPSAGRPSAASIRRYSGFTGRRWYSLALQVSQQSINELGRIAQQRGLVRQLLLELAQRLDERAAFRQRLLDQLAGLLLAHLLGQQEGRALGQHGAFGRVHVGLHGVGIDREACGHLVHRLHRRGQCLDQRCQGRPFGLPAAERPL